MKAVHFLLALSGFLPTATAENKVVVHEVQQQQKQYHPIEHETESPFLSATLKTEISPVSGAINQSQVDSLSSVLVQFLTRIFTEQQVYDVEIVGVAIFEERLFQNNNEGGRRLALNALQAAQFHFNENDPNTRLQYGYDDEEEGEDDGWDEQPWDDENYAEKEESGGGGYTLTFATVVSAEHTQHQSLSHADFQTMLVHVCHKFEEHLLEYVTRIEDKYFEHVKSVAVSGYEEDASAEASAAESRQGEEEDPGEARPIPASILGIAAACVLVSVLLALFSVKFYRRRRQNKKAKRFVEEIARANAESIKSSLSVLYAKPREDDYSFSPLGTGSGYNGRTSFDYENANESFDVSSGLHESAEETIPFGNQEPTAVPDPSVFPASSMGQSAEKKLDSLKSSSSPLAKQPRQHVFAPPGKVGVAIDVVDGQPVVHRVKKGSPLEGMLRAGDLVLAIDDVDTTSMSAADVTSLMVKRMNYGRKITFVRVDSCEL